MGNCVDAKVREHFIEVYFACVLGTNKKQTYCQNKLYNLYDSIILYAILNSPGTSVKKEIINEKLFRRKLPNLDSVTKEMHQEPEKELV